jgi:type I restriction enzyme S subunit
MEVDDFLSDSPAAATDFSLPEGWCETPLGDLGVLTTGNTPSRSNERNFGNTYPWVKPPDLDQAEPITSTKEGLSKEGASVARLLPANTVMVSCIGNLGKVGIAGTTLATNQQINSVTFYDSLVQPRYGFHYCRMLRSWLEDQASATTIPIVNKGKFSHAPFLLAPQAEQLRIAQMIDSLLEQVGQTRDHLSRLPALLKRFRQAVLAAASSGRLTEDWRNKKSHLTPVSQSLDRIMHVRRDNFAKNHGTDKKYLVPKELEPKSQSTLPHGWQYVSSDTLFSFVTSGSRGWAQYYADEGPIFIRIGNLDHGSIELDLSDIQRVRPPQGLEQKRTAVRESDILISITADVGMVGLVPPAFGEAHINQHIALARPVELWYSRYLAWYLASDDAQTQFLSLQRGATKVGLGLEDIKSVVIPFPPQEEQQEIIRRLESLLRIAHEIETRVTAASKHSEKLTHSILAKAFRGELVPTEAELARREGREYEPASVLLERVKKEREADERIDRAHV